MYVRIWMWRLYTIDKKNGVDYNMNVCAIYNKTSMIATEAWYNIKQNYQYIQYIIDYAFVLNRILIKYLIHRESMKKVKYIDMLN